MLKQISHQTILLSLIISITGLAGCQLESHTETKEPLTHVKGIIESLNYTPHGDVDGFILESGVVVHVGRREIKNYNLYKGDFVEIEGDMRSSTNGTKLLEAYELNNHSVR